MLGGDGVARGSVKQRRRWRELLAVDLCPACSHQLGLVPRQQPGGEKSGEGLNAGVGQILKRARSYPAFGKADAELGHPRGPPVPGTFLRGYFSLSRTPRSSRLEAFLELCGALALGGEHWDQFGFLGRERPSRLGAGVAAPSPGVAGLRRTAAGLERACVGLGRRRALKPLRRCL